VRFDYSWAERGTKALNMCLERLVGANGRFIAPQRIDESIRGHRMPTKQHKRRENRPFLGAAELNQS
jgi:hypothetical protein